jgi:hypothetical protein
MRTRRLVYILMVVMLIAIVLRKLDFGWASLLLNLCVLILGCVLIFSKEIFRTLLARIVLASSLFASLAVMQYWLDSMYIILPVLIAFVLFTLLAFKYVQHKPTGIIVFIPIFLIQLSSVVLNPRQFHNLYRPTTYEDFILSKYRQEQGLMADFLINKYKKINLEKANDLLKRALVADSMQLDKYALKLFTQSIENNPDNPFTYHRRGFLKLTRLELNPVNVISALKDFSKAIRLDSLYVVAYYHRSMAFAYLGNKNRSYLDQLKVLQLDSLLPDQQFEAKYGRSKKSLSVPPDS